MPRVTVLSAWTPSYDGVAALTAPALVGYCRRHGYRAVAYCRLGPEPDWWLKVRAIAAELPHADWLLWLDADARVMNPVVRVEDLAGDSQADLYFACDRGGMNNGVLLWRRSAWSLDFVGRWLADGRGGGGADQVALAHLLYAEPRERWHVLPQRRLQGYLPGAYPGRPCPGAAYEPGDFVLHLPDVPNGRRAELFRLLVPV